MDLQDRTEIPLWCGTPPAGENDPEQIPTITPYAPQPWKSNHRALIVFPGGAYCRLSRDEGPGLAEYFSDRGYYCFVVNYRVGGNDGRGGCHHPAQISDAARAVRLVRSLTGELAFHPDRIGVLGSSAGGHLAATVSVMPELGLTLPEEGGTAKISSRPDFAILCYPVITMGEYTHPASKINLLGEGFDPAAAEKLSLEKHVSAETPPTFLYHRLGDTYVPCENSMLYASALRRCGVPFELHIYEKGNHGGSRFLDHPWHAEALRWVDTLI